MEDCKLKWLMMTVDGKMHWLAELFVNNVLAWNQVFALYRTILHVLPYWFLLHTGRFHLNETTQIAPKLWVDLNQPQVLPTWAICLEPIGNGLKGDSLLFLIIRIDAPTKGENIDAPKENKDECLKVVYTITYRHAML